MIASNNINGSGILLDTCLLDGSTCLGKGNVTLNTYFGLQNTLDDNNSYGLYVTSSGSVNLNYVSASKNGDTGIFIDNPLTNGTVIIKNAIRGGSGKYSYNGGDGINIATLGTINLYNIDVSSNAGNGLMIDNCQFSAVNALAWARWQSKGSITRATLSAATTTTACIFFPAGSVYLMNVNADQNGNNGLYVNNQLELAIQPVTINASKGVTNSFNYNGSLNQGTYPGLEIRTYGIFI